MAPRAREAFRVERVSLRAETARWVLVPASRAHHARPLRRCCDRRARPTSVHRPGRLQPRPARARRRRHSLGRRVTSSEYWIDVLESPSAPRTTRLASKASVRQRTPPPALTNSPTFGGAEREADVREGLAQRLGARRRDHIGAERDRVAPERTRHRARDVDDARNETSDQRLRVGGEQGAPRAPSRRRRPHSSSRSGRTTVRRGARRPLRGGARGERRTARFSVRKP